ncbi:MAG: FAD-dependent oxidoreductase [Spirochaetes bacterium]|uniref:FAD-dependent oxidoreductase n=1 Tax=Candidatus Ornithospirochaeta stercoripullorum TaxID=2840899 RepID=A0A9D9DXP4_9SPIO|nr:FAD-dependent oxidoreductase [Candidatus Ornithospirochaeta stercoripullorum]
MDTRLDYDVVSVGGGIAGSLAAVAAARHGARTLIVEESSFLGGSLTVCGTGPMMTFHAGDKQVIKGLGEELIERLKKKGLSPGHTFDSTGYTYTVTPFDAEGMKRELEIMAEESHADILLRAKLIKADVEDGRAVSITVSSLGCMIDIRAKVFIDSTGDATLLKLAGVPIESGRKKDGVNQPMTMNFRLSSVDISRIRGLMEEDVNLFPFLKDHPKGSEKKATRLSFSGFQDIMKAGIASGELDIDRDIVLCFETNNLDEVIVNMTRIPRLNPLDPFDISRAEIEGRRQVWEMYGFLKRHIPGFENAVLISSGPRVGVRSSGRMVGVYAITAEDILSETKFDDGIACCGYPIDIHSDGPVTDSTFLRWGGYYSIPYRCLVNKSVENIMAAGRDISCTFEAHASLRVSPCCTATGQAAGTAAALAVRDSVSPLQVDVQELRSMLRKDGAVVE